MAKPPLRPQTTTLWDYPSQHYSRKQEAHKEYRGATPAYVVWNVLTRYTKKNDLVVDPMCGSGTTIDVARDLGRRALGYDIAPAGEYVFKADARTLPLESGKADFVFVDPPYSTHIRYSGRPECLGEMSADGDAYFGAMKDVIGEIDRVLAPERYMALYICDSFKKGRPLIPIGFRVFGLLNERFLPVDIVAVTRRNKTLLRHSWHLAAFEHNYYLRGFNYLFIMYKPAKKGNTGFKERRTEDEVVEQIRTLGVGEVSRERAGDER